MGFQHRNQSLRRLALVSRRLVRRGRLVQLAIGPQQLAHHPRDPAWPSLSPSPPAGQSPCALQVEGSAQQPGLAPRGPTCGGRRSCGASPKCPSAPSRRQERHGPTLGAHIDAAIGRQAGQRAGIGQSRQEPVRAQESSPVPDVGKPFGAARHPREWLCPQDRLDSKARKCKQLAKVRLHGGEVVGAALISRW